MVSKKLAATLDTLVFSVSCPFVNLEDFLVEEYQKEFAKISHLTGRKIGQLKDISLRVQFQFLDVL